jgi:hypothetical protein
MENFNKHGGIISKEEFEEFMKEVDPLEESGLSWEKEVKITKSIDDFPENSLFKHFLVKAILIIIYILLRR